MRKQLKRETLAAAPLPDCEAADEELALLAEFTRHDSVAALASAIAARLGGEARTVDLITRADLLQELSGARRRPHPQGN